MSIIERVAELLAPIKQPDPKPTALGEEPGISEPDPIERAVSERQQHPEFPARREVAARVATDPAGALKSGVARFSSMAGVTTRTLRIDRERLHRQSMITPDDKRTPIAENFRQIKRRILLNLSEPKPGGRANLVMVTSTQPGEGKSFCAINLAISIALELDHTVLLVDGDVARPSVARALGVEVGRGLMDVLNDRSIKLADVLCNTDIEKLMLLPAGTSDTHATEVLASGAMSILVRELSERDRDRVVIFDSPPLMAASEAAVLASQMGQVVVVVEAGKTTEAALKTALGRIESANIVGLVLNKGERPSLWYGYEGYGGYNG
jgi:protein-tyrosine kinase